MKRRIRKVQGLMFKGTEIKYSFKRDILKKFIDRNNNSIGFSTEQYYEILYESIDTNINMCSADFIHNCRTNIIYPCSRFKHYAHHEIHKKLRQRLLEVQSEFI